MYKDRVGGEQRPDKEEREQEVDRHVDVQYEHDELEAYAVSWTGYEVEFLKNVPRGEERSVNPTSSLFDQPNDARGGICESYSTRDVF